MTTAAQRNSLGRYGEALAARRLVDAGMVLLDRNWRCPVGEIDLVLRDGETLVVCEVKTRRSLALGHPFEAVTHKKANRLRRLAAAWLADHDVHPREVRIDMVGIVRPAHGDTVVEHVRGIG
jgi:putative endonuclease